MAAVLFEGEDQWRALMSIGAERLSDYKLPFLTQEGAQSGAYLGIGIYFDFEAVTLPPIDFLEWKEEQDADRCVRAFYQKPIWPAAI